MSNFDESYCSQNVYCLQFYVREYSDETDYNVGIIIVGALLAFLLGLLICFIIARTCLRGVLLKKVGQLNISDVINFWTWNFWWNLVSGPRNFKPEENWSERKTTSWAGKKEKS